MLSNVTAVVLLIEPFGTAILELIVVRLPRLNAENIYSVIFFCFLNKMILLFLRVPSGTVQHALLRRPFTTA